MYLCTFIDNNNRLVTVHSEHETSDVIVLHVDGKKVSSNMLTDTVVTLDPVNFLVLRELVRMDNYFMEYIDGMVDYYMDHLNMALTNNLHTIYIKCKDANKLDIFHTSMRYLFNLHDEFLDSDGVNRIANWAIYLDVSLASFLDEYDSEGGGEYSYDGDYVRLYIEEELDSDDLKYHYLEEMLTEIPDRLIGYINTEQYWDDIKDDCRQEYEEELDYMDGEITYLASA